MTTIDQPLMQFAELAYLEGQPPCKAAIKQQLEDFQVDEVLGFEPSGSGEHLYLEVRKRNLGTTEVAGMLARQLGANPADIGYAGMKDNRAICTQWFSVPKKNGRTIARDGLGSADLQLLQVRDNDRKLRIGSHRANRFRIRLRDLRGDSDDLKARFMRTADQGVPNYFGPQRLGRGLSNVLQAQEYFHAFDEDREGVRLSRKKKGMLLSAGRSYLFNVILSRRVTDANWDQLLAGEVLNLDGTRRFFKAQPGETSELRRRVKDLDVHPTGLLAGRIATKSPYVAGDAVADLEAQVLSAHQVLCDGLLASGAIAARRSLRLVPRNLEYLCENDSESAQLAFELPAGGYATTLLRELVQY
jgi:tRNA pseudouridine13 synthase